MIQARIADQLWSFDEPFAHETFRWAFDGISQSTAGDLPKLNRLKSDPDHVSNRETAAVENEKVLPSSTASK